MPSERVYAWLSVHGTEVRVRFDDEDAYSRFRDKVSAGVVSLVVVFLKNGQRMSLRPASVDLISRDGER